MNQEPQPNPQPSETPSTAYSPQIVTPLSTISSEELPRVYSPELFTPTPVDETSTEEELRSTYRELLKAAKDSEFVIRDQKSFESIFKEYDEDLPRVTEADWEALSDEWDEDQLEAFRELVDEGASLEEWQDLQEEFDITNEARETIEEYGLTGIGAQFTAALLDPTFLALAGGSVAVGDKVSGLVLAAQRGGRIGKLALAAARLGFTQGAKKTRLAKIVGEVVATDGTISAIRTQTTHDYSDTDMVTDLLASFAAVGAFDYYSAVKSANATNALEEANATRYLRQIEGKEALDAGAKKTEVDVGKFRIDDFALFMNSENPELQHFAEHALQDAVEGGSHSAATQAMVKREHFLARQNSAFLSLWKEHKKTLGHQSAVKQTQEMRSLSEQLWEAVVLDADHGPNVKKAAEEIRKQNRELLAEAKKAGLKGFDDVDEFDLYMKQEWDDSGWRKVRAGPDALDDDELTELIHRGLNGFDDVPLTQQLDEAKQALDEFDANTQVRTDGDLSSASGRQVLLDEVADIESIIQARKDLASGFTNRMINRADGTRASVSELLEDPDSLVKWIKEDPAHAGKSEEDLKRIVTKALTYKSKQKGDVVNRAKRRISIDPSAEFVKGGRTHRVADLMNRDAMGLQQSYTHEMTGNIAFANRLGIKSPSEWQEYIAEAKRKEIELNYGKPDAQKKADKVGEKLEEMKREIFGHNR